MRPALRLRLAMLVINGLHASDSTSGGRAYLVEAPMECVLIDTGAPDGTLGVGHLVDSAKRQPHEVRLIVLTHAHRGHAGNAAELRRLTGARLAASEDTARLLRTPLAAVSGGRWPFTRHAWPPEPIRVDDILEPGQVLDLAGGIEVIDAPGHVPGALAFHCYGPNALMIGDAATVGRSGALEAPPRRRAAFASSARETAQRLAGVDARVICPGHGWPTIDGRRPARQWGPG
jgi:glyoxylase-like metal-dependent hydrolase (beta-lactamase superfamily II)